MRTWFICCWKFGTHIFNLAVLLWPLQRLDDDDVKHYRLIGQHSICFISVSQNYLKEPFTNTLVSLLFLSLIFAIWCHFNALLAVILILLFSPVLLLFSSPLNLVSAGGPLRLDSGSLRFSAPLGGWYINVWNVCLASDESVKFNLRLCPSCLAVRSWQLGTGSQS